MDSPSTSDDQTTIFSPIPTPSSCQSEESLGECSICHQTAHGIHFGVMTCRACAAFFRRTVVLGKKYKCRKATDNCEINKNERYLCRLCRYKKCLQLGMTTDNVQWNRDRLSSVVPKEKKQESAPSSCLPPAQITVPFQQEFFPPSSGKSSTVPLIPCSVIQFGYHQRLHDLQTGSECPESLPKLSIGNLTAKFRVDETETLLKIQKILMGFKPFMNYHMPLTAIQRMMVALKYLRRDQSDRPEHLEVIDCGIIFPMWEKQLEYIAEWMQHCEEFSQLELKEKMAIFRSSWHAFHRLERMTLSLQLFGEEVFTERKLCMFNKYVVSNSTICDASAICNIDGGHLKKMINPFVDRVLQEVCRPIVDLKLSEYEIVYMMSMLVWHLEGCGVSESTMRVADAYRERISNELHDYYIHEKKTPNYAGRLIKIMGLVNLIEALQYERGQIFELARIFDVFKIEFEDGGIMDFQKC